MRHFSKIIVILFAFLQSSIAFMAADADRATPPHARIDDGGAMSSKLVASLPQGGELGFDEALRDALTQVLEDGNVAPRPAELRILFRHSDVEAANSGYKEPFDSEFVRIARDLKGKKIIIRKIYIKHFDLASSGFFKSSSYFQNILRICSADLKVVELSSCRLKGGDLQALEEAQNLRCLRLNASIIDLQTMKGIVVLLRRNKHIRHLDLTNCVGSFDHNNSQIRPQCWEHFISNWPAINTIRQQILRCYLANVAIGNTLYQQISHLPNLDPMSGLGIDDRDIVDPAPSGWDRFFIGVSRTNILIGFGITVIGGVGAVAAVLGISLGTGA